MNKKAALIWASRRGYVDMVKVLIAKGADVYTDGKTALCEASSRGHSEIVRMLIENDVDVRAYDNYALRYAAYYGHLDTVKLLLANGAKFTPTWSWPWYTSHPEIAKLLQEAANRA